MKKINKSLETTILVIDDNADILDALSLLLSENGYHVITSEKGDYAENLKNHEGDLPDLIIMDVLLSGKDGRQITRILKNDDHTKHIPIILISAHPSAEKSIHECGADAFLAKPFDIEELLNMIRSYT